MTKLTPKRNRTNTSLFIGLWLGLTAIAGLCAFVGIFIFLGGLRRAAALPTITPAPLPTQPTVQSTLLIPVAGETATLQASATPGCALRPERPSGCAYGIQSHVSVGDNTYWLSVISDKLDL